MIARITPCAVAMGNSEPETIHIGTSSRFIMAWNPEVESIFHAITKPKPVSVNDTRKIAPAARSTCSKPTCTPAQNLNGLPQVFSNLKLLDDKNGHTKFRLDSGPLCEV